MADSTQGTSSEDSTYRRRRRSVAQMRGNTPRPPTAEQVVAGRRPPTPRRPRPSIPSPATPSYSLFPAPSNPPVSKPLPPLPPHARTRRAPSKSSNGSVSTSVNEPSIFSQSSRETSDPDREDGGPRPPRTPKTAPSPPTPMGPGWPLQEPAPKTQSSSNSVRVVPRRRMALKDKPKDPCVYYLDTSCTSSILASKHGSNHVTFWNVATGEPIKTVKISSYTQASSRGREYFIRSHAILSESCTLAAIATGFGNNIEVWNFAKGKQLQSIDGADRWATVRADLFDCAWPPLAIYRGDTATKVIELYASRRDKKKPFTKACTIDLQRAGLPFVLQYPELAYSATAPLLVAAGGPRPARVGQPPPQRETLLVAWELSADGVGPTGAPYKVVTPWQHTELDTALPCSLAVYGSVVVSIWIPATVRAVPIPASRGGQGYNLISVPVPHRHVLVWDFSANSTRTFPIPNTTAAVSPDCRYVAYCDGTGIEHGARGTLAILDALTGRQIWCWPDPDATATDAGRKPGFEQWDDLSRITELSFSDDGGRLFVGDSEGGVCVYDIREGGDERGGP
ncbi:hypothetical protein GQ53DRAFT_792159 [Thozetella sp. PMI_491]|nr:hypothetical protein GQ53DRAFT_792159 [Thozetella sp. PMI_491]